MSEPIIKPTHANLGDGRGIAAAAKYNPHLWSADELRAIFVARQSELATILQALRNAPNNAAPQHLLITGQRGMGKSTLLQRVALGIEEDMELATSWIALRFPEEQYTVTTPAELWVNVMGALADALERQDLPTLEIDADIARLEALTPAQCEAAALAWLKEWCDTHKRRLLMLMDSTDLLFTNLAGADGKKSHALQNGGALALWRVRKELLHSPHMLWLGGSYQPLEASGLYSDAFLDFFQLIELRPLSLAEMQTAIEAMARMFGAGRELQGEEAVAEIKRLFAARPERLRAMRQLTGGIPRTTVMLYELFAAGGQDSIRADLERLLDVITPLYKARLEVLADQPRKVLAHVMESWAPITAKELARVSALPVGTVSAQLTRLEQEGLIEKTPMRGTKRLGFQVSERFFNIWYLMRNAPRGARARVGWLLEFMRLWYSRDELQGLAKLRWTQHRKGLNCESPELEFSRAIAGAMPKEAQDRHLLEWAVFEQAWKSPAFNQLFELDGEDAAYSTPHDYLIRINRLPKTLESAPISEEQVADWKHEVHSALHLTLAEKEAIAKNCGALSIQKITAIRASLNSEREELIGNHDRESVEQVERAVVENQFFPDCPDSALAYTQLLACFESKPNAFAAAIGRLVDRSNDDVTERACRKAVEVLPGSARPWNTLGRLLSRRSNQRIESESAFLKAIEIDSNWAVPWHSMANLLSVYPDRKKEAEEAYRKSTDLSPLRVDFWTRLGIFLAAQPNRFNDAEQVFTVALGLDSTYVPALAGLAELVSQRASYAEAAEEAFKKALLRNPTSRHLWHLLGNLLSNDSGRLDESEAAYLKAIELAPRWEVLWDSLGTLLSDQNSRFDEAESAYRKAILLDPEWAGPWGRLGDLLRNRSTRIEESEAAYRKAIEIAPEWPAPWCALAYLLSDDELRFPEAESLYRKAIELDPEWASPWRALGELLSDQLNKDEEAEIAFRNAIELDPEAAQSWCALGALLSGKKDTQKEAEAALRKSIAIDPQRLSSWGYLGDLLAYKLNSFEDAEAAYRKAIELDPSYAWPICALGNLMSEKLRRHEEAETIYRDAAALDPNDASPWICLGELLQDRLMQYPEAESAYRKALELDPLNAAVTANLARLVVKLNRKKEADELYRQTVALARKEQYNILLQAHCWLGNRDFVIQALEMLAKQASNNNESAFFDLKEQCFECHAIGLSESLIELMEQSRFAEFLQPFALALRAAKGEKEVMLDAAVEVRSMAEEVLRQINGTS